MILWIKLRKIRDKQDAERRIPHPLSASFLHSVQRPFRAARLPRCPPEHRLFFKAAPFPCGAGLQALHRGNGRRVIGLLGNLGNQLCVDYPPLAVEHHDGTGQ